MHIEYLLSYFVVFMGILIFFLSYNRLTNKFNNKIKFKHILIILLFSLIQLYMGLSNYNNYKVFINLLLNIVMVYIIYKDNLKIISLAMIFIYIIEISLEIAYSFIFVILGFNTYTITSLNGLIIRNLFSIIVYFNLLIIMYNCKVNKFLQKIIDLILIKKAKVIKILFVTLYSFIIYIILILTIENNFTNYYVNLISIVLILSCVSIVVIYKNKIEDQEEHKKVILHYITKYELLIEKYKINKHEMLNNLILLNSYKDKNSKKYQKLINEIIKEYSISGNDYNNIAHLPYGIKGIIYYKMNKLEAKNINFIFNSIKDLNNILNEDITPEYPKICKLLNIFLDNAIEATIKTRNKFIMLDIYKEKNYIIFYIENSFNDKISLKFLNNKYYSTKGKNRGIGLFVANQLRQQTKVITYNQYINRNKNFVTALKVKIHN